MAVKDLNKKLNAIAMPASQKDVSSAQWRRDNKEWLCKSFDIALNILAALKEKGWSQKKLANAMEVSEQHVSKIVKGQENFTLQSIAKLEQILGVRLVQTDFLTERGHTSTLVRSQALLIHYQVATSREYRKIPMLKSKRRIEEQQEQMETVVGSIL